MKTVLKSKLTKYLWRAAISPTGDWLLQLQEERLHDLSDPDSISWTFLTGALPATNGPTTLPQGVATTGTNPLYRGCCTTPLFWRWCITLLS